MEFSQFYSFAGKEARFSTPILFLVFNRINTCRSVFSQIRQARPERLYIASDGPRNNRENEAEKVNTVREYLLNRIDWKCEVKTLFREQNLGCRQAVASAISWFFEHEEQGVILEDDCMPVPQFFRFCEQGLTQFKDDERVAAIGGFAPICHGVPFLSLHGSVWGWATWKRSWQRYNVISMLDNKDLMYLSENSSIFTVLEKLSIQNRLKHTKIDTWDYYWLFSRIKSKGYMVLPGVPLISNLGFNEENSTHTAQKKPAVLTKLENVAVTPESTDYSLLDNSRKKIVTVDYKRFIERNGSWTAFRILVISLLKFPVQTIKLVVHHFYHFPG